MVMGRRGTLPPCNELQGIRYPCAPTGAVNDFEHSTKFPRKPGDLRDPHPEELVVFSEKYGVFQNKKDHPEPVDYYTLTLFDSIQMALIDWQIWKNQGYKRAEA